MEEHLVYSLGAQLVKVKPIEKNLYRISLDNRPIGHIRKKDGGWMMDDGRICKRRTYCRNRTINWG